MPIRIATWNLDHASHGRPVEPQLKKIEQINADIFVLTETCSKVDLSSLDYEGRASAPNEHKKNWSAIWSTWPIEQSIDSYDAETAVCCKVKSPFGSIIVYGTILAYRDYTHPDEISAPWEEHYKDIVAQGEDWHRIRREFARVPLIVAGDFNQSRDGSGSYGSREGVRLLDNELNRSGLVCLTSEDFGANRKLKPAPKTGRYRHNIDHICVSKGHFGVEKIDAWDHFLGDQNLTDHNGVLVDLVLT